MYASIFFSGEDAHHEVMSKLRHHGEVPSTQVHEIMRSMGTALLITDAPGEKGRCLFLENNKNRKEASPLENRIVTAGMVGTRRITMHVPARIFSPALGYCNAEDEEDDAPPQKKIKSAASTPPCKKFLLECLETLMFHGIPGIMHPWNFLEGSMPHFLRTCEVLAIKVEMQGSKDMHAPRRQPSFENICGSVFIYNFHMHPQSMPQLPESILLPSTQVKSVLRRNQNRAYNYNNNKQTDPNTPSSHESSLGQQTAPALSAEDACVSTQCVEVFTVNGNMTMRRHPSGTLVNFKVDMLLSDSIYFLGHCKHPRNMKVT